MEINEVATLKVRELPAGADRKGICWRERAKKSQFDHTSVIVFVFVIVIVIVFLFVMSPHHSDNMSQGSQVSQSALW